MTWAFGNLFSVGGDGVRRISPSGIVTRLNASGIGFSGDGGPVALAQIQAQKQQGIAADDEGDLFFVDSDNLRVRAIRYGAVLAPAGATIQATASGSTIRATVFDALGRPAPGVRVDVAAPVMGSSCTLSSAFAVTDANGIATVSCTPNCVAGSYSVTARPLTASSTATVSFTNGGGPCRRRAVRR